MELYEREFFISEIIYGIKLIKDGDSFLEVRPLTTKQRYMSNMIYMDAYEESLLNGVKTRKEMIELLIDEEIWNEEYENELNKFEDKKEDLKVSIFENFLRPATREKYRKQLRDLEKREKKLTLIKNANSHLDCEGIATFTKSIWITENSVFFEDGSPYDFSTMSLTAVMNRINSSILDMADFRELAREDPFKNLWMVDKNVESIFNRKICELADSQRLLMTWVRVYDAVSESTEQPPEAAIKDDDALDGWFVLQKRKREKEQNKQKLDGLDQKHKNADEVFVMATTDEERREIVNMNEAHGKGAIKNRLQKMQVKGSKGKGMEYHNFGDVSQRKMMQAAAMKNSKRR